MSKPETPSRRLNKAEREIDTAIAIINEHCEIGAEDPRHALYRAKFQIDRAREAFAKGVAQ